MNMSTDSDKLSPLEKYTIITAGLTQQLNGKAPPDLPDEFIMLPLVMAMLAKQHEINLRVGKHLQELTAVLQETIGHLKDSSFTDGTDGNSSTEGDSK